MRNRRSTRTLSLATVMDPGSRLVASWARSGQARCSVTEPAAMVVPLSCCTSAAPSCPYLCSRCDWCWVLW